MLLTRLHLKGAIGIKEGLGLEEIDLNLSGLTGMVALDGDNGRGKTTVLDNLQPYRFLPSRKKKALQHHFYLRDSIRELELDHNGHHYRFLIKVDPEREKQEGYIYVDYEEKSKVNGKLGEYDRFVESIFGSPELFLASVFCAQKADDSKLTTGDLKKQYAEFLRLHEYQERSNTCKQCENILIGHIDTVTRRLDTVQAQSLSLADAPDAVKKKRGIIEQSKAKLDELRKSISDLSIRKDELAKKLSDNQVAQEKLTAIGVDIARVKASFSEYTERYTKDHNEISDAIAKDRDSIESFQAIMNLRPEIDKADAELVTIEKEIADVTDQKNQAVEHGEKLKSEIASKKDGHWKQLEARRENVKLIEGDISKWETEYRQISESIKDCNRQKEAIRSDKEQSSLEFEIRMAKDKSADLEKRDPECTSTICSFITGAFQAESMLPELMKKLHTVSAANADKINKLNDEIVSYGNTQDGIESEIDRLKAELRRAADNNNAFVKNFNEEIERDELMVQQARDSYAALDVLLKKHTVRRDQLRLLAAKRADLEIASARVEDLQKAISQGAAKLVKLESEYSEWPTSYKAELKKLESKRIEINIDTRVETDLEEVTSQLEYDRSSLERLEASIADLRVDMATLEKDVDTLHKLNDEMQSLNKRKAFLAIEASQWAYLKNALGRDGLQALEIDSVAPIISNIANELLSSTFGPSFQVRLDTLTDSNRETLDIWVIRENGTEVLLEDLSGGEKVWVLKALRLARTMIAKEKSGNDTLSAFGDEEDGALRHGETSENFIGLYRAFLRMAGFVTCYYISHKPECVAMADHTINFEYGSIGVS
jgi:exonuclease SbcC